MPRKRNPPSEKPVSVPKSAHPPKRHDATSYPTLLAWLLSYFPFYSASPSTSKHLPAKINPFMALRQGNKSVVIAAVDAGTVSFFRFGQGTFEEWPMAR
jgi:tRNA-splicing endonuclease subunit Sen54